MPLSVAAALFRVAVAPRLIAVGLIAIRLIAIPLIAIRLITFGLIAALFPVLLLTSRIPGPAWLLLTLSRTSTLLLLALLIALLLVAFLIVHCALLTAERRCNACAIDGARQS